MIPPTSAAPSRALAAGEVDAWVFDLDSPSQPLPDLFALLDAQERDRASRLVFSRDRDRFVAAHGMLRLLLAPYTAMAADRLCFDIGPEGKPSIRSDGDAPGPEFNLSHSGHVGLLAVSRAAVVGADVELHRELVEAGEIARSHFAPAEVKRLESLPTQAQHAAFFACWSRKEAYVKAQGGGLNIALDRFEVAFVPGEAPGIRSIEGSEAEAARWTLWDVDVGAIASAAVVVCAAHAVLRQRAA